MTALGKPGTHGQIGLAQPVLDQPVRADLAADFFVVGQVQPRWLRVAASPCAASSRSANRLKVYVAKSDLLTATPRPVHRRAVFGIGFDRHAPYGSSASNPGPAARRRHGRSARWSDRRQRTAGVQPDSVAEIMPLTSTASSGIGCASTFKPIASISGLARSACGAQSPGGLSLGTFTSSARNAHSSAKCASTNRLDYVRGVRWIGHDVTGSKCRRKSDKCARGDFGVVALLMVSSG